MSDKKFSPNADLEKLGNQVRQFRTGRKWSQQKLSDVSGLAVRTISRIERGLMNPSYTVLAIHSTDSMVASLLFIDPYEPVQSFSALEIR